MSSAVAGKEAQARVAVGFMLAAGALVAVTSILAKILGGVAEALPSFVISAGRFGFALTALAVVLLVRPGLRPDLRGAHWRLHLARSFCGWLAITAMFAAVAQMPVAEATAISFLNPVVTMGLAAVLLGESLTARKLMAAGLSMAGAMLILRPGGESMQIAGLYALAAAGLMGLEAIFIKKLTALEAPLKILLLNNMIGATVAGAVAALVWVTPSLGQWGLLALLGVVMVCAQACFLQAMRRAPASLVAPAFYSVLVFAAFYDLALFGVLPDGLALIGAALILSGAAVLARRG